jgi:hypothetical protein
MSSRLKSEIEDLKDTIVFEKIRYFVTGFLIGGFCGIALLIIIQW